MNQLRIGSLMRNSDLRQMYLAFIVDYAFILINSAKQNSLMWLFILIHRY